MRAEEGLVGVDPDAPDALLLRHRQSAEPAVACDVEDDPSPPAIWLAAAVRHLLGLTQLFVYVFRMVMSASGPLAPAP